MKRNLCIKYSKSNPVLCIRLFKLYFSYHGLQQHRAFFQPVLSFANWNGCQFTELFGPALSSATQLLQQHGANQILKWALSGHQTHPGVICWLGWLQVLPRVLPLAGTSQMQLTAVWAHQARLLLGHAADDCQIHDHQLAGIFSTSMHLMLSLGVHLKKLISCSLLAVALLAELDVLPA